MTIGRTTFPVFFLDLLLTYCVYGLTDFVYGPLFGLTADLLDLLRVRLDLDCVWCPDLTADLLDLLCVCIDLVCVWSPV